MIEELVNLREDQSKLRQDMIDGFRRFDIRLSAIGSRGYNGRMHLEKV